MREYRYTTPHGIEVTRTVSKASFRRGLKHLVRELDRHRGIYLSSGYEYPGRYSRWDIASTCPPLEIVAYDRLVEFRSLNQRGRGFDPEDYLAGCAAAFECAPGFPALAPGPRALPNLEDPAQRIRGWSDHPLPACWATIPYDVGFATRAIEARLGDGAESRKTGEQRAVR